MNNNVSDDVSSNVIDDDIPKYVKDNFKYDSDSKSYVYEHKDGDVSVVEKYSKDTNIYDVVENYYGGYSRYNVYLEGEKLRFKKFNTNKVIKSFDFDLANLKCASDFCDDDFINNFMNKYWKNLKNN